MARESDKKSKIRFTIATTLFLASIVASLLIAYLSQQGDRYWVTTAPIPAGGAINPSNIVAAAISIKGGAMGYLSTERNPIGTFTRRAMAAGEILNTGDITNNARGNDNLSLALSIRKVDIPPSVTVGSLITLYQVHDLENGGVEIAPQEIASQLFVERIDQPSAAFGANFSLTISLTRSVLSKVLSATTSGRLVVVTTSG